MTAEAKQEIKLAKANWKLRLKNPTKLKENQSAIIKAMLSSPVPKWGSLNLIVIPY